MTFFIPNPNFADDMAEEREFLAGLARAADGARAQAEQMAPRIMPRNFRAMEIQTDESHVYLVNTDYGGHIAEWGSVNSPPFAPLRRGVLAAGLRFDEAQ